MAQQQQSTATGDPDISSFIPRLNSQVLLYALRLPGTQQPMLAAVENEYHQASKIMGTCCVCKS
jgi:hypothetical protein